MTSRLCIFGKESKIRDISFDPEYGTATGFTQDELEQNFDSYIPKAVKEHNEKRPKRAPWDEQTVREGVKTNYLGFTFDLDARHKVYNPFEIVWFFDSPYMGFEPIWLESAGLYSIPDIIEYTLGPRDDLKSLMERLVKGDVCCTLEDLNRLGTNLSKPDFSLLALLYQTGCVTIKKAEGGVLYVGIPNGRVREAYDDD